MKKTGERTEIVADAAVFKQRRRSGDLTINAPVKVRLMVGDQSAAKFLRILSPTS